MSKSKKNTIDPEKIIENFGADAVRLFIISDSPPEKDVQWSDEGIEASYKFMQRLWGLHSKIFNVIKLNHSKNRDNVLDKITDTFINAVENNLENFRYNKIVANFHELYRSLSKINIEEYSSANLKNNFIKILIALSPVVPHFACECINNIEQEITRKNWPEINKDNITEKNSKYVIQFNGKTREIIEEKNNLSEEEIIILLKKNKKLNKYINENTKIKKVIFIPNKLINIII